MEKAERRWFASNHVNSITKKLPPTTMELQYPRGTYHDSWEEAHAAIVARAEASFARAEKDLQRARARLSKARLMPPPVAAQEGSQ